MNPVLQAMVGRPAADDEHAAAAVAGNEGVSANPVDSCP
jgi:hypothetical protein